MAYAIDAVWDAAKKLNSDLCCMSWNGFNLAGDKKSIDEVRRLQLEVECLQALLDRRTQVTISALDLLKV